MTRLAPKLASLMMLAALALVLEVPSGGAQEQHEPKVPRMLDYGRYLETCNKTPGRMGPTRFLARASLFIARTLQIFKHNALYASKKVGHYLRQNVYTDMSASDIVKNLVANDNGLEPVAGAKAHPDMPAEKYLALQRKRNPGLFERDALGIDLDGGDDEDDGSHILDGYSQAVLPTDDDEEALETARRRESSGPDFLHETKRNPLDTIDAILRDFKPDRRAVRRAARLSYSSARTHRMVTRQMARLEAERKRRGIVQAPLVEPSNKNFDASLLPSHGFLSSVGDYFTMGGLASQAADDSPMDNEQPVGPQEAKSLLSKVVSKIADYFSASAFDVDYMDDEEDAAGANEDDDDDDDPMHNDAEEEEHERAESMRAKSAHEVGPESRPGSIVYDIDWRQTGCISRVKNQVGCNSCYAFATLDLMEFFHCRQKKTQTEFSAQYIIDCGHKTGLTGCAGGKLTNVGHFIQGHGLQLNAIYPYQAREEQCPFDEASDSQQRSYALKPKITGWRMYKELVAWYTWLPKTPVIVGINMPSDFLAYGGGVHDGSDCIPAMNHAMLLVGSGKQDGKPFWLLKNSFSQDWGEAGYFRLSKKAPLGCFSSALVARANFLAEGK